MTKYGVSGAVDETWSQLKNLGRSKKQGPLPVAEHCSCRPICYIQVWHIMKVYSRTVFTLLFTI